MDYWKPMWEALVDTETVMKVHIGSSGKLAITAPDAPMDVMTTLGSRRDPARVLRRRRWPISRPAQSTECMRSATGLHAAHVSVGVRTLFETRGPKKCLAE